MNFDAIQQLTAKKIPSIMDGNSSIMHTSQCETAGLLLKNGIKIQDKNYDSYRYTLNNSRLKQHS